MGCLHRYLLSSLYKLNLGVRMNNEIDRKIAVIFVAVVGGYSKHIEKGIWRKQKNIFRGQKNKTLIWLDLKKG